MTTRAVYAGSFDVLTNGHLWMIEQGAALFDHLIVAIGTNPDKRSLFSVPARTEMLSEALRGKANTSIDIFTSRYLVDYAKEKQAGFILRGIRNQNDYTYEQAMRNVNSDLAPTITTMFLMPPRELAEVSSSLVKGLIGPEGWEDVVRRYVPAYVLLKLQEHANV